VRNNKLFKKNTMIIKELIFLLTIITFINFSLSGCNKVSQSETALMGIVADVDKQIPIRDVKIELKSTTSNKVYTGKTDREGKYKIFCEDGYYIIKATKDSYSVYEREILLNKGINREDFYLSKLLEKPCSLTGTILSETDGKPIGEATIQVGSNIVKADKNGKFKINELAEGEFDTWITAPGYEALNVKVNLTRGTNTTTFKLKPLSKNILEQIPKRNTEYAISPTYLEDYTAHIVRIIYPDKERREYLIKSSDRYKKYIKFDEYVEKGEYIFFDSKVYKNEGKVWKEVDPSTVTFQPDDPIQLDLQRVLYLFNFEDLDIDIKEIGREKVNNYNTRMFTIKSKTSASKEKTIDVIIWIIDSSDSKNSTLNRVITKIKGKTAYDTTTNTWPEVDIDFTNIGGGNVVEKPKGFN